MKNLKVEELAKMIDHTQLKPFVTLETLKDLCITAAKYDFKTVAINNAPIKYCRGILDSLNSNVLCDAAVSFPLGQATIETKVFEAIDAIYKGAGEVDYVCNLTQVKGANYAYIQEEMERIVAACHSLNVPCKVIFENCYLEEDEKKKLCEIALRVKPDFIKTSTGFGPSGATLQDVKLMKSIVGDEIKIKAAGGIRSYEAAIQFIEAGASRIGTSSGVKIIEDFKAIKSKK
jgi:deoxyribose-phosphate aldolase